MISLQIITILFSIACAWLNKWPVLTFRYHGLSSEGEKDFHAANAIIKIGWAVTFEIILNAGYWPKVLFFLLLLLIQWFVFDIALNFFTHKPWYYLGESAWIDKLIKNGKLKAVVALLLIIALNIILCLLPRK